MLNTPYGPAELLKFNFAHSNGCFVKVRFKSGDTVWFSHREIGW